MNKEVEKNIRKLFEANPGLVKVFQLLKDEKIKYGIFAGAHVSLLTSNRPSTDIAILVSDDAFPKLSKILDGRLYRKKGKEAISNLYYLKNTKILEFVSKLDFIVNGRHYPIRLTPLSWDNVSRYTVDGVEVMLLSPVDTILEKAIMPRGSEVGNHDLEDIEALMNKIDIDREYLHKRVNEMKGEKIVKHVLQKYDI